jgi:pyruvate/2-oxoglutarate dehydrogenase complex dihydrolipoamide acyltransferase (E2) component
VAVSVDVLMPVITEEGEEAVVTAWFVDDGQPCTGGQLLAEVQAEKVADEVYAPAAGFVVERVGINDPVHQGRPICRIADEASAPTSAPAAGAAPAAGEARSPTPASPAAKRVARELGVDLASVTGSGPGGRITEDDVRAAAGGAAGAGLSGLRAVIARTMRRSHAETAPVTLFTTVDLGPQRPDRMTARAVRAAARALVDHPMLDGHRDGDTFTPASTTVVGVAIQTDDGLVAPVIRDPAARSLDEVAEAVADLADRSRTKRLTAADFEGGTFTVTNLGAYGVDGFTPIIDLPQVAILGVGAARRVPVFADDDSVVASHQMVLSLTFDHAFVDGAPAAEFLRSVAAALGA